MTQIVLTLRQPDSLHYFVDRLTLSRIRRIKLLEIKLIVNKMSHTAGALVVVNFMPYVASFTHCHANLSVLMLRTLL